MSVLECPKCKNRAIKVEMVQLPGKFYPFTDRVLQFKVFICQKCGFSQFYFEPPLA